MKYKLLGLITLLGFAGSALAGGFNHYDKNGDGYISAEELGEKKAHKLEKMDSNADGLISQEEFDAYKASKSRKHDTT